MSDNQLLWWSGFLAGGGAAVVLSALVVWLVLPGGRSEPIAPPVRPQPLWKVTTRSSHRKAHP